MIKHSPSYSFKSNNNTSESKPHEIGPGAYVPNYDLQKRRSPSFSIPSSAKIYAREASPGPGNYNTNKTLLSEKGAVRFSNEKRLSPENKQIPGPGSYDYESAVDRYLLKQSPRYHIASRYRQNLQEIPGPGQYAAKQQSFSKIGGIISRDMRSSSSNFETPGPGTYRVDSVDKVLKKTPSFSLPKSPRQIDANQNIPGPGAYQSELSLSRLISQSPRYVFNHQPRLKESVSVTPGPGSYLERLPMDRKVYIGQKFKETQKLIVPGPGAYEVQKGSRENWSRGISVPRNSKEPGTAKTPGPGDYNAVILGTDGPKICFPKTKRNLHNITMNPGPGQYQIKPSFADVPKYLIPQKQ